MYNIIVKRTVDDAEGHHFQGKYCLLFYSLNHPGALNFVVTEMQGHALQTRGHSVRKQQSLFFFFFFCLFLIVFYPKPFITKIHAWWFKSFLLY